jgi:hypothetical protein
MMRLAVPHQVFVSLVALVPPSAMSGCMAPSREAKYAQGITFIGRHKAKFEIVAWARARNNPQPCPLIVHLPQGDFAEKELADPKTLIARGWAATEKPDHGLSQLSYRRGNLVVWAAHRGGMLEMAGVNALTCSEPQMGIVSIDGKRFSLPISEDDMIRLLGQPNRRR